MNLKFDQIASVVFLAIGILVTVESQKISSSAYGSTIGPNTFPMGLGILLIVLSVLLFIETIQNKKTYKIVGEHEDIKSPNYKRFIIIFLSALGYVLLLDVLGYLITTFVFLVIGFQTLERGKILTSIIIAAVFSSVIYFGFVNVLGGSLPGLPF
ncbi:tripartite tricarboxylate transporter TctB family protein [Solibacillus daqui]|uniref:tripartite tricarboxylate transporter TctB family protein n=1 Tax=Solibacillus daqui TaxID=2912187 RepID=UPI002366B47E|nr:tripartite tricarboxylate transporter TctB family protein [Solibacillus daqui]